MRGSLCVVGLILLFTTEGSAFRHALKKTDLETPLGKYIIRYALCICLHILASYCSCSHNWWMSYSLGYALG